MLPTGGSVGQQHFSHSSVDRGSCRVKKVEDVAWWATSLERNEHTPLLGMLSFEASAHIALMQSALKRSVFRVPK